MERKTEKDHPPKPIRISSASPCHRDDVAALLLLTPRHVNKLAERGVLPRRTSGRFDLVPAVQGYIQHLRKANGFGDELGNAAEHKLRLLKAKADVADIEAKKAAGEYVAIDEVERTWADNRHPVPPTDLVHRTSGSAVGRRRRLGGRVSSDHRRLDL